MVRSGIDRAAQSAEAGRTTPDPGAGRERGTRVLQAIVVGLVLGSIYALAASGLVITYVSTGVLNFAFGALAFFIARTYYWMHVEKGWGILLSAGLCLLVLSPTLGLMLYYLIFRHLRLSSQLIKVVVTLGISVVV